MELIERLPREKINNRWQSFCLYLCPYCNKIVKRRLDKKQKSCGCAKSKLMETHGDTNTENQRRTRLYRIWTNMKQRCYNKNSISYKYYGKRGIKVCKQWKNDYVPFKTWALIHGYKDNLTIDRKENNGNYGPLNCKWSTIIEQNRNQTKTKLTIDKANKIRELCNKNMFTRKQLSVIYKVSYWTICDILNNRRWT